MQPPPKLIHESIPAALKQRTKNLFERMKDYGFGAYEQFEFGFCCDNNPEPELRIWEMFAETIDEICKANNNVTNEEKKALLTVMIGFTLGKYTEEEVKNSRELSFVLHWYVSTLRKHDEQ